MLSIEDVEQIAFNHVESFGEVLPNFKYGYTNLKEFTYKFYYDFVYMDVNGQIPEDPPVTGGACGFCIDKKTREVVNITFAELARLQNQERKLNTVFNQIVNVKENNKSLYWLKNTYGLSSEQLLEVIKNLKKTDLEKERIIEQLGEIIKISVNKD